MNPCVIGLRPLAGATAILLVSLLLPGAAAAQITIGQLATRDDADVCSPARPADEIVTDPASGPGYAVPAPGGVITSWSTRSFLDNSGQRLGLMVFHPVAPSTYVLLARDERELAPEALNTFSVSVPVQAGDVIGLHIPSWDESALSNCSFETAAVNRLEYFYGTAPVAARTAFTGSYKAPTALNFAATLLPPPTVTAVTPASGSIAGGSAVTVAGTNFAQVRAVSFGATPATDFGVDSEGQLTATAPAGISTAGVPVTVTTVAGSATSAATFAYSACAVPKLRGQRLKPVKRKLKRAGCGTGKVSKKPGATWVRGKVVDQRPKAGTLLAPGSTVRVTLGP